VKTQVGNVLQMRSNESAPETEIVRDMVKHAVIVSPLVFGLAWVVRGADGAWSSAYALLIVLCNYVIAAGLVALTARVSYALMLASSFFGYLLRLAIVAVAVMVVRDAAWVDLLTMGLTLIVLHLGLLFYELRFVSATLAFPGLRPRHAKRSE
jgi:hypothetical protein